MSMIQAFRPGVGAVKANMTAGASSTVSAVSCPIGASVVRVASAEGGFRVEVGTTPTAGATSVLFPTAGVEYFLCGVGDKVAVIRSGAADVSVNIAFLSR